MRFAVFFDLVSILISKKIFRLFVVESGRTRNDAKNDSFRRPGHDDNGIVMKRKPNDEGHTRLQDKRVRTVATGRLEIVRYIEHG